MTTTPEAPAAVGTQGDQAAVAALTQRVVAAWAYNDADAFAALFTEDGTMILPGIYKKGRAAINEFLTDAYQNQYKGTQVTGKPLDLRFLAPDVALLITYGGVLAPGESTMADEQTIRATWTAVRIDGQWKLAAYQNSPALHQLPAPGSK